MGNPKFFTAFRNVNRILVKDLYIQGLKCHSYTCKTGSPMPNEQRNVMTNSLFSQPWQTSGMTVLAYPSKSDTPTITNWKNNYIDAFERYCTQSRLFQSQKD